MPNVNIPEFPKSEKLKLPKFVAAGAAAAEMVDSVVEAIYSGGDWHLQHHISPGRVREVVVVVQPPQHIRDGGAFPTPRAQPMIDGGQVVNVLRLVHVRVQKDT